MKNLIISSILLVALAVADDQCTLACPDDYHSFTRTPTANNSYNSLWCVKPIFTSNASSADPITEAEAQALCAADGAVLTIYENADEKAIVYAALKDNLGTYRNSTVGSLRLDGHRIPSCKTLTWEPMFNPPCTDPFYAFTFDDIFSDPTYVLTNWARKEPSGDIQGNHTESCLLLGAAIYSDRDDMTNDYYCELSKAPDNIGAMEFWPWGALCGKLPSYL